MTKPPHRGARITPAVIHPPADPGTGAAGPAPPPWNRRSLVIRSIATALGSLGILLLFNWPPNWWPDMPPIAVHLGVGIGILLLFLSAFIGVASFCENATPTQSSRRVFWSWWLALSSRHGIVYFVLGFVIVILLMTMATMSAPSRSVAPMSATSVPGTILATRIESYAKIEFKSGSESVALAVKNMSYYAMQNQFQVNVVDPKKPNKPTFRTVYSEDVFVVFEKPTLYGQLVVNESGGGDYVPYEVKFSNAKFAVLLFSGDIKNKIIEIRTLSVDTE
jgi:hypothetical protein